MADRTVRVRLTADIVGYTSPVQRASRETDELRRKAERFSGRTYEAKVSADTQLALFELEAVDEKLDDIDGRDARADVHVDGSLRASREISSVLAAVAALGPAAVAAGVAATGALGGIASSAAVASAAVPTLVLAFQGVGDALTAVDKFGVEPTQANFEALNASMGELTTAGREFVRFLHEQMRPRVERLQNIAQAGLLPGVEDALRDLLSVFPTFEQLVANTSTALGQLAREAGQALTDPFWRRFFTFLADEAQDTLLRFGRTLGNVATGFAGLVMAFDPLADDMESALLRLSRRFAEWGTTVAETQGFREFVAFVGQTGPEVLDTLGEVAEALLAIVQAAAPIGQATLPIIRALAEAVEAVAESNLGPVLIGMAGGLALFNRAVRAYDVTRHSRMVELMFGTADGAGRMRGALGRLARFGGGALAVLALNEAVEALKDHLHDTEIDVAKFSLQLREFGNTGQAASEVTKAFGDDLVALEAFFRGDLIKGMESFTAGTEGVKNSLKLVDQELATLVGSGNAEAAAEIFGRIEAVAREQGFSIDKLNELFPTYRTALKDAKTSAEETTPAAAALAEKFGIQADEARRAADAVDRLSSQLDAYFQLTFGVEAANDELIRSYADLADEIEENGATTRGNTVAAANNRTAIQRVVQANFDLLAAEARAGASKAELTTKTQQLSDQLFNELIRLGVTRAEARRYANDLRAVPEEVITGIELNGVRSAESALSHLTRDRTVKVTAFVSATGAELDVHVRGGRFQHGGLVVGPGTATSDSIPARLSAGEFVVNAAAVQRFGAERLAAINAMTAPRFADGGLVTSTAPSVSVPRLQAGGLVRQGRVNGTNIVVERLEIKAPSDSFRLKQVVNELALHGVT